MRRHIVFGIVCLGLLLASITTQAVNVALGVLRDDLTTTLVLAGWVSSGYSLMYTVVMPLAGKITDIAGRKLSFVVYVFLFTVGSVSCALAPNIYILIASRVIQAIGGGGIYPCAAGIVNDTFPEARQKYIGLFSSVMPLGIIIGPNLGGWLVQAFGWRYIFWMNVPLGILVIALGFLLLPADTEKRRSRSIDFVGAGILCSFLFSLMFGLTLLSQKEGGVPWLIVGALVALSLLLVYVFVRWEKRVKEPVIDLELLNSRPFLAANIYNLIYGMCGLAVLSLIPLYAQTIYHMSVLESGLLLTPRSIMQIASSAVVSVYLTRMGYRRPILVGTLTMVVGFTILALRPSGIDLPWISIGPLPILLGVVGMLGFGHGTCTPAASNACIELMPDKVSTITGLRGMFRQMGNGIGMGIATGILSNVSNIEQAFTIVLIGSAIITAATVPAIYAMPASATEQSPVKEKAIA